MSWQFMHDDVPYISVWIAASVGEGGETEKTPQMHTLITTTFDPSFSARCTVGRHAQQQNSLPCAASCLNSATYDHMEEAWRSFHANML
eukprot:1600331-Amphidinium_carterae.1